MRWKHEKGELVLTDSAFHCDRCDREHETVAMRESRSGVILRFGPHWKRGTYSSKKEAAKAFHEKFKSEVQWTTRNSSRTSG